MILAVLQSSVILVIAYGAAWMARRQSAALRHLILTVALFASIAVPFLGRLLPERTPRPSLRVVAGFSPRSSAIPQATRAEARDYIRISAASESGHSYAFVTWVLGICISLAIILAGMLRLAWLARRARPLGGEPPARMKRDVRILRSNWSVLGTWGFIRPCILLPLNSENWPDDRLRAVLTHELAHIQRFDWPVQMIAELARAFYWFNPLFWLLCRRLRAESEHACDDVVLNTGISARDYATHLLELARTLRDSTRAWSPVLAMARPPHLERRFVAMLNPSVNRNPVSRRFMLIAGILGLFVTLPLGAVRAGQQSKPAVVSDIVAVVRPAEAPAPAIAIPAVKKAAPRVKPVQGLADGSVSGTVSDATGAVIPGVTVTVSSRTVSPNAVTETDVQTTTSDQVGTYEFRGLTPGQYVMKAQLPGFALFRSSTFQITSGQNVIENAALSIGSIMQRVELTVAGQAKPRAVSATTGRMRVGGNIQAARLISQVKPVYPAEAQQAGIEGIVHLQGFIGTDGTLIGLYAERNIRYLTDAALAAVSQWRYSPSLLNNEPVQVPTSIDIEFKLEQ